MLPSDDIAAQWPPTLMPRLFVSFSPLNFSFPLSHSLRNSSCHTCKEICSTTGNFTHLLFPPRICAILQDFGLWPLKCCSFEMGSVLEFSIQVTRLEFLYYK
jgi:hypothetical protein